MVRYSFKPQIAAFEGFNELLFRLSKFQAADSCRFAFLTLGSVTQVPPSIDIYSEASAAAKELTLIKRTPLGSCQDSEQPVSGVGLLSALAAKYFKYQPWMLVP